MRISLTLGLGLLLAIGASAVGVGACKETAPGATKSSDAKPAGDAKPAAGDAKPAAGDTKVADAAGGKVADVPPPAPPVTPPVSPPAPKPVAETPAAPPAQPAPAPVAKPAAEAPPAPAPAATPPPAPKQADATPAVPAAPPAPPSKPVADLPPSPVPASPVPASPAPASAPKEVAEAPTPQPTPVEPPKAAEPPAPSPAPQPTPPAPTPAPTPAAEAPPAPAPSPTASGSASDTPAPAPSPAPQPAADTPPATPAPQPTPMPPPKGKYQAQFNGRPVKTWAIQLQNPDPDTIARTPYDVVTIDYSRDASAAGAFSKADVAKMKKKPDGSERVLIAYMSIGEIEDYRYYWQENGWNKKSKRPSWIGAENPEWLHNYTVKFWNQGWKDIIYAKPNSYLDRIIDAGFDGVYLDKIDITDVLEDDAPKGKTAFGLMVEFVQGIRAAADKKKPGFLMVASNAEAALDDDDYRATMSAIGKEDLYFNSQFNAKTGKLIDGFPNDPASIKEQIRLLQKLIDDDKVVLSVEYLDTKPNLIPPTAKKLAERGYVPYFGPRDLARLSGFTYAPTSLRATALKAVQCSGLAEDKCGQNSSCVWIRGYEVDETTSVPGYCRIAPTDTTKRLNVEARE